MITGLTTYQKKAYLIFLIFFFTASFCIAQLNRDSIEQILPKLSGIEKADALIQLSKELLFIDLQEAIKYAEEGMDAVKKSNYNQGEAEINLILGRAYIMQGKYNESITCFENALKIASENGLHHAEANALNSIGNYYYMTGEMANALEYYMKAFEKGEKLGNKSNLLNYINNIGVIYGNLGEYEKSIEYYLHALRLSEEVDNKRGVLNAYINIGTIYYEMKNNSAALENYNKALNIARSLNDSSTEADCLINIGLIYTLEKKYNEALNNYLSALTIKENVGDKNGVANCLINAGSIYGEQGNYKKALEYHQKALDIHEEIGNKEGITTTFLSTGRLHKKIGNYISAIENFEMALSLSKDTNVKLTHDILVSLAEAYPHINNYTKAYQYLQESIALKDSIFNENTAISINELKTKYDFEKQETKILLLQQSQQIQELELDNQIMIRNVLIIGSILILAVAVFFINSSRLKSRTNKLLEEQNKKINEQALRLKELNANKDKFFSIIAHDLRNPLVAILGFSEVIKNNNNTLTDTEVKEFSSYIYSTSKSLNNLLNNLLDWSKFQSENIDFTKEPLNLKEEVELIKDLYTANIKSKNIMLENKIDENIILYADKNMLRSMLQNLISNSIKFSFENGNITTSASNSNGCIKICIEDSGMGIKPERLPKLLSIEHSSSTKGTAEERGSGLGLLIVKEMVEKHGGKIDIESVYNQGTKVRLTFPAK